MAADPDLLLRELSWLRRLAGHLVADPATADDLASDTVATWLTTGAPTVRTRGWLATVLRHRAARLARRERMRAVVEAAAAPTGAAPAVDEAVARTELHRAIVDAVLALPEPYRTTIVLRYLDALPMRDVAVRLGVPIETVHTRIQRGLERLRRRLDERCRGRDAWVALLVPGARNGAVAVPLLTVLMTTKVLLGAAAAVAAAILLFLVVDGSDPGGPVPTPTTNPLPAGPAVQAARPDETTPDRVAADPGPVAPPSKPELMVRGRVVEEGSLRPLAGISVGWLPDTDRTAVPATTGSDGTFVWTTPPRPERHRSVLLFRGAGHALRMLDLPPPVAADQPLTFELGEVTMPPGTGLRGTVVAADGSPVGGIRLHAVLSSYYTGVGRTVWLEEALDVGATAGDGTFQLAERLLPNRPSPLLLAAGEAGVGHVDLDDLRRERSEREVVIQLLPPASLRVHVVDEGGDPVVDAMIVAEPRFPPLGMPGTQPMLLERGPLAGCFAARSDRHGSAELRPLAVRTDGASPYTVRVHGTGRDTCVVRVDLPRTETLEVVLPRSRDLFVRGTARDEQGRPVRGVLVDAAWGEVRATTGVGDDGSYTLRLARDSGPLHLRCHGDHWFDLVEQRQPLAADDTIGVDFVLRPALRLRGDVVDQHGAAVAGAMVLRTGDDRLVTTDTNGRFVLQMAPATAQTLHLFPPEPDTAFAAEVYHTLTPGQDAVTLVLERRSAHRAALDVELVDANGAPLEAARAHLAKIEDGTGRWHATTSTIGRVQATDLSPGPWRLVLEPTRGCALRAPFEVRETDTAIRLRLAQPLAGRVHGELVPAPTAALPAHVELQFAEGCQRARFVPGVGQEVFADGRGLRLDPATDLHFTVVDVDPERPLTVIAQASGLRGHGRVRVASGREALLRVPLQPEATLALRSPTPLSTDGFGLQLWLDGDEPPDASHCEGLAGQTSLLSLPIAAGTWHWRVVMPTLGADNRGGPVVQQGTLEARPGATVTIDVVTDR